MSTTRTITDAELLAQPEDDLRREIVDGEILVMNPAGMPHGWLAVRLSHLLMAWCIPREAGWVFDSSTGFRLPNGNLRAPDLAFIARERMPDGPPPGFSRIVPDFVVEILSPDDTRKYVERKRRDYLEAGVRLIWEIDPERRRATIHAPGLAAEDVAENGLLGGRDVLPGFGLRLSELL